MPKFDAHSIGLRMAKIRRARKLSQDVVAGRIGIHRKWYGKYERGQAPLTLARLNEIAAAIEATVDELLMPIDADVLRRRRRQGASQARSNSRP